MKPSLTAVIVEDEARALAHLEGLLRRQHPEVDLLGNAVDVEAAIALVRRAQPQVLFLDIELKDRTSFDILKALGDARPHVIFTTAHDGYMLQAIRFSCLDYLLKPIDPAELREAVAKAQEAVRSAERPAQMDMLLKNIDRAGSDRVIAVPVADGLEFVHVNEILACESDSNYTTLHLRDGKRMVISRSMKQFEDLLQGTAFMRVHNSWLVSLKHIRKYLRGDGGEVVLSSNLHVPVARRKKQELMDSLEMV
ncbi:MAG: response regulator transcription factor [Flavobacteriales bacterium]|nr:response regulator transcription factor [Flavobacteriales bacterium]